MTLSKNEISRVFLISLSVNTRDSRNVVGEAGQSKGGLQIRERSLRLEDW
jgi:hypothetical protein